MEKHERILLLRRIDTLLKIPGCQEKFIPELERKLDNYERTQCNEEPEDSDSEDEKANKEYIGRTVVPTGATRRGGANKSVYKKLKIKSKKTKKVKRFRSRRNKK